MTAPRLMLLAAGVFSFFSCGQRVDENLKKEYVLGVANATPEISDLFSQLTDEFNALAEFPALRFSSDSSKADSLISLTKDLQATDGKVGWGQWITQTKESNAMSGLKVKLERDIDYAMRLEFDEDYIQGRMTAEPDSPEHYDLQKLFFHEVGHGLQMPHHPNRSSVMFYEISGQKDFAEFFRDVRKFFEKK